MGQKLGWGLSLGLLLIGLIFWGICQPELPRSQAISISLDPQRPLMARLYLPKTAATPTPAVVLCHGVSSTKETMAPLAIELARQGIAALSLDQGGFGESYRRSYSDDDNARDAKAALNYLRQHPEQFDVYQLGIAGHSMGGTTALVLGTDDRDLHLAIVWGMQGIASRFAPSNLLLGGGLYEEFHPPTDLRKMLQMATGQALQEFQPSGDFAKGTARMLLISPTADHLSEPFDPLLVGESVQWARQAFGLPRQVLPLIFPWYGLGLILIFLGSLATGVSALLGLTRWLSVNQLGWILGGGTVGLLLTILLLWQVGCLPALAGSNGMILALVLLWIGNYALRSPQYSRSLRAMGLYALLALLAYGLVLVFSHLGELLQHPAYLLGLPGFLLELPLAMLYSRYQEFRAELFSVYSIALQPTWLLLVWVLPEVVFPGRILLAVERGSVWFLAWLRQPLQMKWHYSNQWRSLLGLGLALLLLLGILVQRWQSGLISQDSVGVALNIVLQMVVLPGAIMAWVARSPTFQKLEQRWLRGA